jgi:hypothetical protein
MMLADDLGDNEWELVEALFCAKPARKRVQFSMRCYGCSRPAKAGPGCRAATRRRLHAGAALTSGTRMARSPK